MIQGNYDSGKLRFREITIQGNYDWRKLRWEEIMIPKNLKGNS